MIPRNIIFGNPDKAHVRISPNGEYLSFLAPKDGVLNVWIQKIGEDTPEPLTNATKRGINSFFWSHDNSTIIYSIDNEGDENWQLHKVDIHSKKIAELINFKNVSVTVANYSYKVPDQVIVTLNKDHPDTKDVYNLNITTGNLTKIFDNTTERFSGFTIDDDLNLRLAYKIDENGNGLYFKKLADNRPLSKLATGEQVLGAHGTEDRSVHKVHEDLSTGATTQLPPEVEFEKRSNKWELLFEVAYEDTSSTRPVSFTNDGQHIYFLDSREHNNSALYKVNLESSAKELIYANEKANIVGVYIDRKSKELQGLQTEYMKTAWVPLSKEFEHILNSSDFFRNNVFEIVHVDLDNKNWIITHIQDNKPNDYYLFNKDNNKLEFLFSSLPALADFELNHTEPVLIKSRDGLDLVSYLTLPRDAMTKGSLKPTQPVPMVLLVHGGPAVRDSWGMNNIHQWLSNRGYGVLSVNYRGSAGLGKQFFNSGSGQWGKKMHLDLIDAVNWAVAEKIADPSKVAIMGGSYGGYATLVGLTMTPEVFACGIDIVGPSNLETLLKSIPPYWKPAKGFLTKSIGATDDTEEGRAYLKSISPLTFVSNIKKPLLIAQGKNDPRVKQAESEQIVSAMRARHIPVTYLLYPDEGHGFARPENRMSFYAVAEGFLSKILGGDYEPTHPEDISKSSMQER